MDNFANQCLDMAQSILSHNLDAINQDGTITPLNSETSLVGEPAHAALALGEYYRATQKTKLNGQDILDLAGHCITQQASTEEENESGLAYTALALLSFGPAKDRNVVWERLSPETQEKLDRNLLARTDSSDQYQVYNIAKAVARFSMGLSKKDETGKLIDKFIEKVTENSSTGYIDSNPLSPLSGSFNVEGVLSYIFIRQSLQLHSNIHLRERKLPSLRTYAEKYIKLFPDLVRMDGLGWSYGDGVGAYGQMHIISLTLQAMRDGWISEEQRPVYIDMIQRLFHFFFATYLDQEHGYLVIRDAERSASDNHTTRMANFDAARYLCQWSRLAKTIGVKMTANQTPIKNTNRFISFDKSNKKEQGVFIYQDANTGLHVTIPLVTSGQKNVSNSLAFPHSPGIFDYPVNHYMPVMLPELTFGEHVIVPSFYGKHCVTGLGFKKSINFKYDQPELVTKDEQIVPGLGSWKVSWTFAGDKISCEFILSVKNQIKLDKMRYCLALSAPHSTYHIGSSFTLGEESLRAEVLKDDFQATWQDTEVVSDDPNYRTSYGKIHYIQTLLRDHPLVLRPGQQYKLAVSFQPHLAFINE